MNEQRPSNEVARRIKRTCEMSAGIMRDKRRTGGWEGAEKVARQFDRLAELASQLESTAHEPSVVRDALEAIASPSRHEDYGWWTQVARRALGYATKNEAAQPPTEPLCPCPFSDRPNGFTMAQCILAGECGCTAAACEARKAQPPSEGIEIAVRGWIERRRKELSKQGITGGHYAADLCLLEEVLDDCLRGVSETKSGGTP